MYTISYFDSNYTTTHLFFASNRDIADRLLKEWITSKIVDYKEKRELYERVRFKQVNTANAINKAVDKAKILKSKLWEDWQEGRSSLKSTQELFKANDKYVVFLNKCEREFYNGDDSRIYEIDEIVRHYLGDDIWEDEEDGYPYVTGYKYRTFQEVFDLMSNDLYEIKMDELIDYGYTNGD